MRHFLLQREQWIPAPRDEVFPFFADAANLESITPPWLHFCIVGTPPRPLHAGATIVYRLGWWWIRFRWVTAITVWDPPARFEDVQRHGPYPLWQHTHEFNSRDDGTLMRDTVRYALPFGPLGTIVHRVRVQHDLQAIFDYRAEKIRERFGGAH